MSGRKRALIIIASVVSLLMLTAGIFLGIRFHQNSVYVEKINSGNRYYTEGDYENAVLAYQAALNTNPKSSEAYAGLARSYSAQGMDSLAIATLERGVEETGGIQLQTMLLNYQEEQEEASIKRSMEDIGDVMNVSLINAISISTYEDYEHSYSIESVRQEGKEVLVRVSDIGAELVFYNTASQPDAVSGGKVRTTSVPEEIRFDNAGTIFGVPMPVTMEMLEKQGVEGIQLMPDDVHGHVVRFIYMGCAFSLQADEKGTVEKGAWNSVKPVNAISQAGERNADSGSETQSGTVSAKGTVKDAVTGDSLSGVSMKFFQGNTLCAETVTDSFGEYTVDLASGDYMVKLIKDGYVESDQELYIGALAEAVYKDFTISPELMAGEIRIVLTWGSSPRDLDSYVTGETDEGKSVYTSFISPVCMRGGKKLAELDVDQQNGYGPETTTIYDVNGTYHFRVVDYNVTGTLAQSGAQVTVYLPGKSPMVFNTSDGIMSDNEWDVFTIDHGEILPAIDTSSWWTTRYNDK